MASTIFLLCNCQRPGVFFMSKKLAKCNFKNEIFITSYLIIAKKHAKHLKNIEK